MGTTHGRDQRDIGALIVDDEADVRLLIQLEIERRNHGLFVAGDAGSGDEALAKIDDADPAIVVLDLMMPGMDGIETAGRILERRPQQKILLFSAFLDAEVRRAATATGITECLPKDRIHDLPDVLFALADD